MTKEDCILYKDRQEMLEALLGTALDILGYRGWEKDPNLEGTPRRVAKLWMKEVYKPELSLATEPQVTVFPEQHSQMVLVAGHTVWTHCPHHLERVKMRVSMAYIQGDDHLIIGASKMPRLADFFAHGMVLQEAFTDRLADFLFDKMKARGVGVHVVGQHHCMCARGVETDGVMVTTSLRGIFGEDGVKN